MNQQSKNEEYWRKRVLDDLKYLEKLDADLAKSLRELYQKEYRELQKMIQAFYEKYSENHQISIQEARQRLHHEDLSDYQELANQFYNERYDMSPEVRAERLKRLNQLYEASKAVRMDELLLQTQLQLFAIQVGLEKASNDYLTSIAKQGLSSSFGIPNTPALEQIVKTKFDGKNYSNHIWDNVDRLANNLKDVFTKGFIRGLGSDEMARELRKKLNVSQNQALAVIRTDGTMILNQATIERYKKDGFTRYRDLVTLDMRTSEICKGIKRWNDDHPEGKLMSEAVVGVNIAPYHVNCRTGIIPVEAELYDDSHIRELEEEHDNDKIVNEQDVKVSKKNIENAFSVDRQIVNSKVYHDKFEILPFSKLVNESLYKASKAILEHRDGSNVEDLYILNSRTGKEITKNISSKEGYRVGLSNSQYQKVLNEDGIVILHNHPEGGRLSIADIKTLFNTPNAKASVVVGHDSSVHIAYLPNRSISIDELYDKLYNKFVDIYQNKEVAKIKATDKIYAEGVFRYEEIR